MALGYFTRIHRHNVQTFRHSPVAEISGALAEQRIGFEELHTDIRAAPMAGGMLFEAHAVLEAPPATDMDDLRERLEAIADELMVDILLSDVASDGP